MIYSRFLIERFYEKTGIFLMSSSSVYSIRDKKCLSVASVVGFKLLALLAIVLPIIFMLTMLCMIFIAI